MNLDSKRESPISKITAICTKLPTKNYISSQSGDDVCLEAWRQGSCEPLVKIILVPAYLYGIISLAQA